MCHTSSGEHTTLPARGNNTHSPPYVRVQTTAPYHCSLGVVDFPYHPRMNGWGDTHDHLHMLPICRRLFSPPSRCPPSHSPIGLAGKPLGTRYLVFFFSFVLRNSNRILTCAQGSCLVSQYKLYDHTSGANLDGSRRG